MAKKSNNLERDPHKWVVGLIMWIGVIYNALTNNIWPAFIGISVALAYFMYYR